MVKPRKDPSRRPDRAPTGRLRIIAGSLRGRLIEVDAGRELRPTANRVREALFSRLGNIAGKRVLDLYAGSGALGIEALSRGAAHVTFVDCSPKPIALLKENLNTLGVMECSEIFLGEALKILPRLRLPADAPTVTQAAARTEGAANTANTPNTGRQFDLVFLDPPYASGELDRVLSALVAAEVLAPGAQVVVESERKTELPSVAELAVLDSHLYGDTRLTRLTFDTQKQKA